MNQIYLNTTVNQMNTFCVNINLDHNYPMATNLMAGHDSSSGLMAPKDTVYIKPLPSNPLSQSGWCEDRSSQSPQSSSSSLRTSSLNGMSSDSQIIPKSLANNVMFDPIRYKTEMCKNFLELGHCKFGVRCYYAHFTQELKVPTYKHKKYKTQLCKPFHLEGFCDFGLRCAFIHSKPNVQKILNDFETFLSSAPPMPDINAEELNYTETLKLLSFKEKRLKTFENISLNLSPN